MISKNIKKSTELLMLTPEYLRIKETSRENNSKLTSNISPKNNYSHNYPKNSFKNPLSTRAAGTQSSKIILKQKTKETELVLRNNTFNHLSQRPLTGIKSVSPRGHAKSNNFHSNQPDTTDSNKNNNSQTNKQLNNAWGKVTGEPLGKLKLNKLKGEYKTHVRNDSQQLQKNAGPESNDSFQKWKHDLVNSKSNLPVQNSYYNNHVIMSHRNHPAQNSNKVSMYHSTKLNESEKQLRSYKSEIAVIVPRETDTPDSTSKKQQELQNILKRATRLLKEYDRQVRDSRELHKTLQAQNAMLRLRLGRYQELKL